MSTTTASGAIISGEAARVESMRSRSAIADADRGQRLAATAVRRIRGAPPRALFRRRIQVDFHVGIGKDHRPDVAPFHHDAAVASERPLARDEQLAHRRHSRHRRHGPIDLRRANRAGDVHAVHRDLTVRDEDVGAARQRGDRGFVLEIDAQVDDAPGQRPIHRAGVDVPIAERVGNRARDRALPHARRPVDGDHLPRASLLCHQQTSVAQGFSRCQRPGRPEGLRYYLSRMPRSRSRPTLIAALFTL